MDWAQYFAEFMENIPGGYAILGVIGGAVCLSPFIPKIISTIKTYKAAKAEEKKAAEERKKKEDEERLQQIVEEREFRKKVTTIMEVLPEMTNRINDLTDTAKILKETNEKSTDTHDSLTKSIAALDEKVDKLDKKMGNIENSSSRGDEALRSSISQITIDLQAVTGKVDMIIESDLDAFRNYLIDMYHRHVYDHEPMEKRDIELLCMKFKKYKREGGNGWAEKLYFEILQCDTTGGIRAEEIARQFHYLIETAITKHPETSDSGE